MPVRLVPSSTALAVSLLLAAAPAALAQQPPPRPQQAQRQARTLSSADLKFAKEAAIGGLAEVQFGKVAEQNGHSAEVKQFGARMVRDHGAANNQLMGIAQQQGLNLPRQLDSEHQRTLDRLSRLRGAAFDRAYMRAMVKDHDQDARVFRNEAQTTKDPALKQFAENTLNVIEQHDRLAHAVDRSLTAVGSSRRER